MKKKRDSEYLLDHVLGKGGALKIEAAIKRAELMTSGEIVVRITQSLPSPHNHPRHAAIAEFGRLGVHTTAQRNGVLIYTILDKHAVELVADEGVSKIVDHETWRTVVDIIAEGYRSGEPAEATARAVEKVGEILSKHFPYRKGDRNELNDRVIGD